MAKKKGSRAGSRAGSEFGDDASIGTASLGRRSSYGGDEDTFEELEDDPFEVAVEQLYEKRASTREAGLLKLVNLLTAKWQYEECCFRQETLSQLFLNGIRRGGIGEATLAARALGLHAITLGASDASESIFADAGPVLEPIILTGKSAAAKPGAADALSMLCFVGAEGPEETLRCMMVLARAFSSSQAKLQAVALRGWTLLLTTVPAWRLDSGFVESHLSLLAGLLHSDDVEVRGAAGEAVALLYSTCGLAALPESPALDYGSEPPPARMTPVAAAGTNGKPPRPLRPSGASNGANGAAAAPASPTAEQARGSADEAQLGDSDSQVEPVQLNGAAAAEARCEAGVQTPVDSSDEDDGGVPGGVPLERLEQITDRMRDLARNRGDTTRRSRRDRASLKGTFRELCNVVEDGAVPSQKIKLRHGDVLVVDTLPATIRLNAFRRFLAEGFQVHLQENTLLHEVFSFQPRDERPERLSAYEKRMYRSPASAESKARSQDRRSARSTMASYKGSMML